MSNVINKITGSVSDSTILVAGGDINLTFVSESVSLPTAPARVLLTCLDYELRSCLKPTRMDSSQMLNGIIYEMKLLLIAIPPEGCLVLPPSYYCESELSRLSLNAFIEAIENSSIRLVTDYDEISDYMERKRSRYRKAAHFDRYREAYYFPQYPSILDLPFSKTFKEQSVGSRGLALWSQAIESDLLIRCSPGAVSELRKRTLDSEVPSFLWENVGEHMMVVGINPESLPGRRIRVLKNRFYLTAYHENGFSIPTSSTHVTTEAQVVGHGNAYNVSSWHELFRILGLMRELMVMSPVRVQTVKARPEIAGPLGIVRELFSKGHTADYVVGILSHLNLRTNFVATFLQL